MARPKTYNVSDGKLVLTLTPDEGGWYCVTAPMHPGMVTQAKSITQAFDLARDAIKTLEAGRKKQATLARQRAMSA